jgi:hypothetical protein
MTTPAQFWNRIHPSVFHEAAGPLLAARAIPRPHGAVRYRCPINGSLVLVTDDKTLGQFDRAHVRLRCGDCGEMHLLTCAADSVPAVVVAGAFKLQNS